jgi:hypothetical protein
MINIVRQNRGRARTKFNILLKPLKPRHQQVLLDNPIISKNSTDDRFIQCLFRMTDRLISVSHLNRPYINPQTREISLFREVKNSFRFMDWECAYCKTAIKTEIHNYKEENFTCKKCYSYYVKNAKIVSQMIIDSSLRFTERYKKILIEDQKKFLKYIKKNDAH